MLKDRAQMLCLFGIRSRVHWTPTVALSFNQKMFAEVWSSFLPGRWLQTHDLKLLRFR